jgi:uncharacterized phage-associated protein
MVKTNNNRCDMHSSIKIANYFLKKAKEDKKDLTPLQLMKLVYLAHGWMLGVYGRHLIKEPIEAWQYGPVIPDLYHKIKKFRSSPVEHPIDNTIFGFDFDKKEPDFDENEKNILGQVYDIYSNWSGIRLSTLTHMPGSPWDIVWKMENSGRISNDVIMDYYKRKYNHIEQTKA